MAKKKQAAARRRKDESDDDSDAYSLEEVDEVEGHENAAFPVSLEDEEPSNDGGDDGPSTPVADGKRKRAMVSTPSTQQEEAELARRRRRRQSLVFQKRRQSLTPSKAASTAANGEQSRQYISDMYSTIIKMSSENKINSKNTWSLHLIDHMDDILSAPHEEPRVGAMDDDTNTFNFQKASCTLDASIKIYSYRVDDTWTSSYKILENLSRSGSDKRGADLDDGDGDDTGDHEAGAEGEEDAPQRRGKKKSGRRGMNAGRTVEKNLNHITVKSYEVDFEPDPLFHKMSQTFDEGGAKGMLLANLSVYDGAKILLNSADVKLSTRKLMTASKAKKKSDESEDAGDEDRPYKSTKLSLASLGKLPCFLKDVRSISVCPPLSRLYDQIEEMRDHEYTQSKVVLKESVLKFEPRRARDSDSDSSSVPFSPTPDYSSLSASIENTTTEDTKMDSPTEDDGDVVMDDAASVEGSAVDTATDDNKGVDNDDDDDDDDDNKEPDDHGYDFGDSGDVDMDEDRDTAASVDGVVEDAAGSVAEMDVSVLEDDRHNLSELDPVSERQVDPVAYPRSESPPVIRSAADYFRKQMLDDGIKKEEDVAYSQLIETALMRSVVLETEGTVDHAQQTDYSYFDAKMLKNWAGPTHHKFKPRKITAKLLAFDEEVDGAAHEGGPISRRGRKSQKKPKDTVAAAEKKSLFVDFLSPEVPDLAKLLRPAHLDASTVLSKLIVRKQIQKAPELVYPVDVHIESKIFFRHFMKPRLHLFHRRTLDHAAPAGGSGPMIDDDAHMMMQHPSSNDAALADTDHLAYEDGGDYGGHDFGGDDYSDGDSDAGGDDEGAAFSQATLVAAERVVEKIDVHYERVAKRVDVKKLKTSLWTHLETETGLLGKRRLLGKRQRQSADNSEQPEPEAVEEDSVVSAEDLPETTTFDNVVHSIADKVPANVTVSFYFICMLHLANEKGLRLTGQEDLSDFVIKKEEPLLRS